MELNITVPAGTTNHGNPRLVCMPTQWSDILIFFGANYLAHAITLTTRPGQSLRETIFYSLNALFVPGFGAVRAITAIRCHAGLVRGGPFKQAATAGALCMVLRRDHYFSMARTVKHVEYDGVEAHPLVPRTWFHRVFDHKKNSYRLQVPSIRHIHGMYHLPQDYVLVEVPPHLPLRPLDAEHMAPEQVTEFHRKFEMANSWNMLKVLISLYQAVWAIWTLYRARGDQIDLYGYAAFGLSVAPYAIMSIMNIIANLVTPQYPTMYLVHTPDMDEAGRLDGRDRGQFYGVVAALDLDAFTSRQQLRFPNQWGKLYPSAIKYIIYLLVAVLPIGIVLGVSHASLGSVTKSQPSQSTWMLCWLLVGTLSGFWVMVTDRLFMRFLSDDIGSVMTLSFAAIMFLSVAPLWIASIGGMVVVGYQLVDFGTCVRLDT